MRQNPSNIHVLIEEPLKLDKQRWTSHTTDLCALAHGTHTTYLVYRLQCSLRERFRWQNRQVCVFLYSAFCLFVTIIIGCTVECSVSFLHFFSLAPTLMQLTTQLWRIFYTVSLWLENMSNTNSKERRNRKKKHQQLNTKYVDHKQIFGLCKKKIHSEMETKNFNF